MLLAEWLTVLMVALLLGIEVFNMTHHDHKKCDCHEELEEIRVELSGIRIILGQILERLPAPPPLPTGGTIKQLE